MYDRVRLWMLLLILRLPFVSKDFPVSEQTTSPCRHVFHSQLKEPQKTIVVMAFSLCSLFISFCWLVVSLLVRWERSRFSVIPLSAPFVLVYIPLVLTGIKDSAMFTFIQFLIISLSSDDCKSCSVCHLNLMNENKWKCLFSNSQIILYYTLWEGQ